MTDYSKMTVATLVERYVEFKTPVWTSTPKGEANAYSWKAHAKGMLQFFGNLTLGELCEPGRLRTLCLTFRETKTLSDATVRKQLQALMAPLIWAWRQQWIDGRPLAWLPPAPEARDRKLSDEEAEQLLDCAGKYPTEYHTKVFTYLALFTPAQRHAVLSLTWDRVDFSRNVITFDGRAHGSRMKVAIHDRLRPILEHAHAANPPGCKHVVSWRGNEVNNISHTFKLLRERAGLEDVTFNDIRKWMPDADDETDEDADEQSASRLVISYCTKDGMMIAAALCDELEKRNHPCWISPRDQGAGAYSGQIIEAIEAGIGLVVVLTAQANESSHMLNEVNAAHDSNKMILPVIVDGTSPAANLRYYLATPQQIPWSDGPSTAQGVIGLLAKTRQQKD